MNLAAHKDALRRAAMDRRAAAHAAAGPGAADLLVETLAAWPGAPLAAYAAMRSEIDPMPAMRAATGPVGLPVIVARAAPLRFRAWSPGTAMIRGPFGVDIPETGGWIVPRVVIVPLLAFDRSGGRLGYGGGFYDRTLAELRARGPVTAIGFAYAAQQVDRVPTEETDAPLDLIVTEAEAIRPGLADRGPAS
ncbi:5-formyltetrahydrofolate cyclo-ligase [Palleronia sediminis]|uniref:5-formyltetrahydrofolate cyclo-ligase n=1 Tax=Palleronia sediminis TaxID=2547833 RepID=A0A4R6A0A7_9RHOB|nr:5-formyltetrahydrofolate cyclo-ligase [Palleronia sediminis]TDL75974.1 5-formyltetrahydrofolate cyclo-ligase [Palleronia sediminis]